MVSIRLAQEEDFEFFYEIKCEDDDVYWSGIPTKPDKGYLREFWNRIISNQSNHNETPRREAYIIENYENGLKINCGYLYADHLDNGSISFGLGVAKEYTGKKIGRNAITSFCNQTNNDNFIAIIREDNIASQKMFANAGFVNSGAYEWIRIDNIDKELKMLVFTKQES
jgi:RimJ/RimL family protein N-acetyltransferase